jgi:glycosyltransferase involved in cell wall biosynthesis
LSDQNHLILPGDTETGSRFDARHTHDLVADDSRSQEGVTLFQRDSEEGPASHVLPIHFFTIVLNGEPFIRYHERVFRRLTVPWHWHVIEGVAALKHDTGWSVAGGGRVPVGCHDNGRSNDGTTAYLDDLGRRFPEKVTIYRKPPGQFWDGKKEMVNAPLPGIREACLLWQVDSDELWSVEQIETVHDLFQRNPERTAAYYWCWYYVGPGKIVSTRYNYAQNPKQEWLRTWRYRPGAVWTAHEPPTLVVRDGVKGGRPTDIARINPFTQDDMEQAGAVFHHFAYATEQQLAFKELYYGYRNARAQWRALQAHNGSGRLRDFFAWVPDDTMFDDAAHYLVDPIARPDPSTERWTFDGAGVLPSAQRHGAVRRPRILVDGIFWQYLSSGIGRVWENLLAEWVDSGFTDNIVLLDRAGTAPRIAGVHYWTIGRHDYAHTGRDSLDLEAVCRRLDADMFVSTYYSTPTTTPSFFVGYDMIPERLGFPLQDEAWREKHRAILHASAHSMISKNSAKDLENLYPSVTSGSTHVAYCGVAPAFARPSEAAVVSFRRRHALNGRPYVLMVGERLGYGGYKNAALAFRALAALPDDRRPVLICVGGSEKIEAELRKLAPRIAVRRLALDDAELCAAYAGAHALLNPSRYEGFGMPPLESMACGTPAIVCRNSSSPEVGGDAVLYVDEDDPAGMTAAIINLYDPGLRAKLVERGLQQAAQFTFAGMARDLAKAFVETHEQLRAGSIDRPSEAWAELRGFQHGCQASGIDIDATPKAGEGTAAVVQLTGGAELERALRTIAAMRASPFWKLRELAIRVLRLTGLRGRG